MQLQAFTGRAEALATLGDSWQNAAQGSPHVVVLEGAEGSGRRALVSKMLSDSSVSNPLILRLTFTEGEDALKILLRMYAELYVTMHDNAELRESIKAHTNELLLEADGAKKVWLMAFREGMERDKPDLSQPKFEVTIPRQSPYLGLLELIDMIASKHPVLLELVNIDNIYSYTCWTFFTLLLHRTVHENRPFLMLLSGQHPFEAVEEVPMLAFKKAFLENLDQDIVTRVALPPLSEEEIVETVGAHYSQNRFPAGLSAQLFKLSGGNPGRLADILEQMEKKSLLVRADDDHWLLNRDDTQFTLQDLLPELPGDNPSETRQVLRAAAMEGTVFTARIISQLLSLDKDSVDDQLDELEELIEEVTFHENIDSWLYRFKSPSVQRILVDGLQPEARKELARSIGELIAKEYLARSTDYAFKSARLWLEAGDSKQASSLLALAATAERQDMVQMGVELVKFGAEASFAPQIYQGLHLNFLDKAGPSAAPDFVLQVIDDFEAWAQKQERKDLEPVIALHRARALGRKGAHKEAESFGKRAQKGFARQKNRVKEGEALNLLAYGALARGEAGMANEYAARALNKTEFVPVRAHAMMVKGIVLKTRGELQKAIDQLKTVLDLTGRLGLVPVHLDAGLNIAECLLMGGKPVDGANLLGQLIELARKTRARDRERTALSLQAKCYAASQDIGKALEAGSGALKLDREMKRRANEATDLLDLGIYSLVNSQADEAVIYLREAEKIARELDNKRILKEILFHHGIALTSNREYAKAHPIYKEALELAREMKDPRREGNILFNIGGLYLHQEEFARARTSLDAAAPLIEAHGNQEEKKALAKAVEQLEIKLN